MKKIAIFVITYNQENVISRALDSILKQKEWGLYRIVVSDDCSQDRTWEILLEYKKKYPDIVYVYRNERNLGIYGNFAKTKKYLNDCDFELYGVLSGDDEFCDGYLEGVQKLIETQHINVSEAVGVFSDWKSKDPEGNESVFKQDAVLKDYRLFSLKIRKIITSRSLLVSKIVYDAYEPVLIGKSLNVTEEHSDLQPHLNIKKVYYLPQVTTVYYSGIGASTALLQNRSKYITIQSIEKWNYIKDHYYLDKRDLYYAKYCILKAEFLISPSLLKLIKIIYYEKKGQLKGCHNSMKESMLEYMRFIRCLITSK